jgi:hypothetical protein
MKKTGKNAQIYGEMLHKCSFFGVFGGLPILYFIGQCGTVHKSQLEGMPIIGRSQCP